MYLQVRQSGGRQCQGSRTLTAPGRGLPWPEGGRQALRLCES